MALARAYDHLRRCTVCRYARETPLHQPQANWTASPSIAATSVESFRKKSCHIFVLPCNSCNLDFFFLLHYFQPQPPALLGCCRLN